MRSRAVGALALAAAGVLRAGSAAAVDPPSVPGGVAIPTHVLIPGPDAPDRVDYVTPRYEPAGFPLVGGNSDTGFMFGVAGTLTRFSNGIQPYLWNMDLVLSASVKDGPTGPEITEYNVLWNWDIPGLLHGRLRLNPMVVMQQVINDGYFGLGDASSAVRPANISGVAARYFESMMLLGRARVMARYDLGRHLSAAFVAGYRYAAPSAYDGSLLARNAAMTNPDGSPWIRGLQPLSLPELSGGLIYDSRDSEIMPTRGMMNQVSVRVVQGLPLGADVRYTEIAASVAGYAPLFGPVTFAGRIVGDVQIGNVPFYDLLAGGPFNPDYMPGGSSGVRGVPFGRYLGPVKFVANLELRAWLGSFTVVGQHFRVGTNVFFDTGRVWSDLTFHNPLDGTGLGLKFGVGAGLYLRWGQAAIFRIEAAYSPDAAAENPAFPIGLYVEDGVMF